MDHPILADYFEEPRGVQPEAWVLTAMMTAPFTMGLLSLFTVATAAPQTWL